jgi:hypothetical protein
MRLASHYSKKTWSMISGVEEEEDSLFFPFSNFYILFSLFICLHIFFPYLSLSPIWYLLYTIQFLGVQEDLWNPVYNYVRIQQRGSLGGKRGKI